MLTLCTIPSLWGIAFPWVEFLLREGFLMQGWNSVAPAGAAWALIDWQVSPRSSDRTTCHQLCAVHWYSSLPIFCFQYSRGYFVDSHLNQTAPALLSQWCLCCWCKRKADCPGRNYWLRWAFPARIGRVHRLVELSVCQGAKAAGSTAGAEGFCAVRWRDAMWLLLVTSIWPNTYACTLGRTRRS